MSKASILFSRTQIFTQIHIAHFPAQFSSVIFTSKGTWMLPLAVHLEIGLYVVFFGALIARFYPPSVDSVLLTAKACKALESFNFIQKYPQLLHGPIDLTRVKKSHADRPPRMWGLQRTKCRAEGPHEHIVKTTTRGVC